MFIGAATVVILIHKSLKTLDGAIKGETPSVEGEKSTLKVLKPPISTEETGQILVTATRKRKPLDSIYIQNATQLSSIGYGSEDFIELIVTNCTKEHVRLTRVYALYKNGSRLNAIDNTAKGVELVKRVPSIFVIGDPDKEIAALLLEGALGEKWQVNVSDVVDLE